MERVESVARAQAGVVGYAIALSNDSSYWRVPATPRATIDGAFRLHERSTLTGDLRWAAPAGAGTTRGRERPHFLHGTYRLHWRDCCRVADGPAGTFRYLWAHIRRWAGCQHIVLYVDPRVGPCGLERLAAGVVAPLRELGL